MNLFLNSLTVTLPSIVSQFPGDFVDPAVFPRFQEEAKVDPKNRVCCLKR